MGASEFNHHVPLYFFLLKLAMMVLPSTEAGVRTLSVVASATALIAVLIFLRTEWSLAAAVYAGILMALSSFDLYYAQETRMYTLLAAAWIISYISLVKALQGKSGFLVVWAIAMIVMPWTHLYGFLLVGTNLVFVAGYLVLKRIYRFASPVDDRWLLVASVAIVVGILPMVRLLLLNSDANSQGASISGLGDILDLYLLWTAGLVAARNNFADSAHLTLPATETLSPLFWFVAGTIICGAPAVYGLVERVADGRVPATSVDIGHRQPCLAGRTGLWLLCDHGYPHLDTTSLPRSRLFDLSVGGDRPGSYQVAQGPMGTRSRWPPSSRWLRCCRTSPPGRKAMRHGVAIRAGARSKQRFATRDAFSGLTSPLLFGSGRAGAGNTVQTRTACRLWLNSLREPRCRPSPRSWDVRRTSRATTWRR